MIYLFLHQNFPGQYRHLVTHLVAQPGNTVYFITQSADQDIPGVNRINYTMQPAGQIVCHPFTLETDAAIRVGMAVAKICELLKDNGIKPDCMIGHNGWGETLFVKDVFPDVPLLAYFEFFYRAHGIDVGFDPECPPIGDHASFLRVRNSINHIGFDAADWGNTATHWQRSVFPVEMQSRITAIHEGVDVDRAKPDPKAWIRLSRDSLTLTRDDEIITYVARNLEPYRGFHIFMRALPEILRRRPRAHIVLVGGDDVSYGRRAPGGITWREAMLREVGDRIDLDRVHFLGQIAYAAYMNVLQVSSVHVYLTYPWVLSWSFVEALSAGCVVLGSSTPPVLEVLRNRVNGLTVDFFSTTDICDRIDEVLDHPNRMEALRVAARETAIAQFDLRRQLPRWLRLIDDLIEGRPPPGASRRVASTDCYEAELLKPDDAAPN